jgi:N-acyl-L-homoserine lactone synthetase
LAIDDRKVIGGIRLNPTTGPTLLNQVFPYLSEKPLVGSPDAYDKTRLWWPRSGAAVRVRQSSRI